MFIPDDEKRWLCIFDLDVLEEHNRRFSMLPLTQEWLSDLWILLDDVFDVIEGVRELTTVSSSTVADDRRFLMVNSFGNPLLARRTLPEEDFL
jgi:hypothetical protein